MAGEHGSPSRCQCSELRNTSYLPHLFSASQAPVDLRKGIAGRIMYILGFLTVRCTTWQTEKSCARTSCPCHLSPLKPLATVQLCFPSHSV